MGNFSNFKVGEQVSLSGDLFKGDREKNVLMSSIVYLDANKALIELPNRGWFLKDNNLEIHGDISNIDQNKKYYWVFDETQISKIPEAEKEPPKVDKMKSPFPPKKETEAVAIKKDSEVKVSEVKKAEPQEVKNNTINSATPKTSNKKEDTIMTTPSFVDTFKKDSVSAGYRVAGRKLSKLAQNGLVAIMKSQGAKRKEINAMLTVVDTTMGRAVISQLLGQGLQRIPGLNEDPRVLRLAEELRVESLADGIELSLDGLVGKMLPNFLPEVSQILESLPKVEETTETKVHTKTRVAPPVDEEAEEEAEEEHAHKRRHAKV